MSKEIIDMYQKQGYSIRAIAAVLGKGYGTIWRALDAAGIERRPRAWRTTRQYGPRKS